MRTIFFFSKRGAGVVSWVFTQQTSMNKIFKHTLSKLMVPVSNFNKSKEHYIKLCLSESNSLKS